MIKIRRGLDIPLAGAPEQSIAREFSPRNVALVGADYIGMKPTMAVAEGDTVAKGQALFTDKKCEGVVYAAPASGRVSAINRGARRVFQSIVIEVDESVDAIEKAVGKLRVVLPSGGGRVIRSSSSRGDQNTV